MVKLDGKSSFGRPKRIWNGNIKMDIRAIDYVAQDLVISDVESSGSATGELGLSASCLFVDPVYHHGGCRGFGRRLLARSMSL